MKFINNRSTRRVSALLLVAALFAGLGTNFVVRSLAASSGSIYLSPASSSVTVGDNITVAVKENSGSTAVSTVDADLRYPTDKLQYVSATTEGTFPIAPPDITGTGAVQVTRTNISGGQTGDQLVTNVTFKTLAAGSATISFGSSTAVYDSANGNPLSETPTSGTYTINAAQTGGGTGPTNGGSTTTTGGGSSTTGTTTTTTPPASTKSTSVKVTPTGGSASVNVPSGATAEVTTPVDVQPAATQSTGVSKVEYFLDGKLIDTETKTPYSYTVNTKSLKNGTHLLVTKTTYSNGTTKLSSQNLVVKNAAKHSSWGVWIGIIVFLLIVAAIVYILLRRRKNSPSSWLTPPDGDTAGVTPSAPTGVTPPPVAPATPAEPSKEEVFASHFPTVTPSEAVTAPAEPAPTPIEVKTTPAAPAEPAPAAKSSPAPGTVYPPTEPKHASE